MSNSSATGTNVPSNSAETDQPLQSITELSLAPPLETDVKMETTKPPGVSISTASPVDKFEPMDGVSHPGTLLEKEDVPSDKSLKEESMTPEYKSEASPATSADFKDNVLKTEGSPLSSTSVGKEGKDTTFPTEGVEATEEAKKLFEVIDECIYFKKSMADADQDGEIMTCECRAEWSKFLFQFHDLIITFFSFFLLIWHLDGKMNTACGEDSDCINRATRMECVEVDCGCGEACQNMRFQRREYANVSVMKAHKKGYGLRSNTCLAANDFIYEYVGEVIDEQRFTKRMESYDKQGIKHFYFMSLKSGEFIDATKKGGLGRFCNHSCNPNCYVDKWVVGDKLRMGIFAKRDIKEGEELVFDYNVDRYGADPQECYCGEANCVGYIGGKTQTNAGTRLSHHVIEALGLDGDEVFSGKKPRKTRKTGEPDEDYTENIPAIHLGEKDVTKVMSTLLHCKERWIIHKLLSRIEQSTDAAVPPRVVRFHGYQILGRILHEYKQDDDIVLMALNIMAKFPRITKNKITSSKIEPTVQELAKSENEKVRQDSAALLSMWNELETAFRIPRRVGGAGPVEYVYNDRQRASRSKSKSPERAPPTGPKGFVNQIKQNRGPPKRPPRELPWGWHKAKCHKNGQQYYYSNEGQVTWYKPSGPCEARQRLKRIPPPPDYEYIPLEREPLPENLEAHKRAQQNKEDAEQLRKLCIQVAREKEQERLEQKRRDEEEAQRREEEEKLRKKEMARQRKIYEINKKKDHVETQVKKYVRFDTSIYLILN
jgi:[histone H3]-lysine36 N-trimethyltransferase